MIGTKFSKAAAVNMEQSILVNDPRIQNLLLKGHG